jgi:uncharacterized damage-inducible protein DinB
MKCREDAPRRFPTDLYRVHALYNLQMKERIYAAAAKLSDEQRKRDVGAFFRSIHLTLNHLVVTDRAWLARFGCPREAWESRDSSGVSIRITGLDFELYSEFATLRRERARTDADIEQFIGRLSVDRLQMDLEYSTSKGDRWTHPLWWALGHFFNHQTHHRGQVTTMLSQLGVDPGVTDLVAIVRDEFRAAEI